MRLRAFNPRRAHLFWCRCYTRVLPKAGPFCPYRPANRSRRTTESGFRVPGPRQACLKGSSTGARYPSVPNSRLFAKFDHAVCALSDSMFWKATTNVIAYSRLTNGSELDRAAAEFRGPEAKSHRPVLLPKSEARRRWDGRQPKPQWLPPIEPEPPEPGSTPFR